MCHRAFLIIFAEVEEYTHDDRALKFSLKRREKKKKNLFYLYLQCSKGPNVSEIIFQFNTSIIGDNCYFFSFSRRKSLCDLLLQQLKIINTKKSKKKLQTNWFIVKESKQIQLR